MFIYASETDVIFNHVCFTCAIHYLDHYDEQNK